MCGFYTQFCKKHKYCDFAHGEKELDLVNYLSENPVVYLNLFNDICTY